VSLLGPVPDPVDELICSARGKVWLACDDHREHLSQYLDVRGFLRDVVPVSDLERVAAP